MKTYILLLLLTITNQIVFDFQFTDVIIYGLTLVLFINFIRSISVRINIFDIVGLIASLVYLILPLIVYNVYNEHHPLARYWDTYMTIDKNHYFSLALPATILFILGLNTASSSQKMQDSQLLNRCKIYLADKKYLGVILIIIGGATSFLTPLMPLALKTIVYYFSQLTFIGFLYLLHSGRSGKGLLITIVLIILIAQSVVTGMYGELVYWSILGGIILLVGKRRISVFTKIAWLSIGIFVVLLIQSIKHEYRAATWGNNDNGGSVQAFSHLVKERLSDPASLVAPVRIYGVVIRGNQGRIVGRTMDYVPRREEFADGETIITTIAAAFVPRFLWPDKPEVGGVELTCRFLGDCVKRNYSYNIGQLGESYVNFGMVGGAVFMFFYGYFMRISYVKICNLSIKYPTLILWIPLFFFMAISLETDFNTFLNSFIKALIFAFICYFGFKVFLNIRI